MCTYNTALSADNTQALLAKPHDHVYQHPSNEASTLYLNFAENNNLVIITYTSRTKFPQIEIISNGGRIVEHFLRKLEIYPIFCVNWITFNTSMNIDFQDLKIIEKRRKLSCM